MGVCIQLLELTFSFNNIEYIQNFKENENITPGQETNWKNVFILSHQIPYYICMGSSMMMSLVPSPKLS